MSEQSLSEKPLAGLRVLDVSTMLAGPYGATLLGDLGADVIKVESHLGDDSRRLGAMRDGECGPFLSLNRSKRAIVIDMQLPQGQELFAKLAATTDVLITNVREPALSKLGLNYEQVKAHRPDIVWIGVTAFGPDGPYAGRPGIDFLTQGYCGVLGLNGEPDGGPVRTGFPAVDVITSLLVSNAALAALRVRDRTGQGQRVEVSLLDALMHAQASSIGSYLATGEPPRRTGNRSQYFAPSGVYPTKDGRHVIITTPSEKFFGHVCRALDAEWDTDPRFHDITSRLANHDELDRVMSERTRQFNRDELVERLIAADVLTAPINDVDDVVNDPQIRHNRMIVGVEHPLLGNVEVTGVPIRFYSTPCRVEKHPPMQGEHTRELLATLGYTNTDIDALISAGVAADRQDMLRRREARKARRAQAQRA
ncbi:acyl-CoA transferase [Steroidobacter denitrificans]|uniref:Acyl-CoA transferase n=1 Tax=Steroidobacter denitrificans TaxID=465721 RepID=A0A127F578_STEDE|nr:CoA transferase [Steroidobacter denitrificans]AMN45592.1 acyl-CoA transferase [Steroidobacter denitrificans]